MSNSFVYLSKDGETLINAVEWKPEGEPKAVLQICHGMLEYIKRYDHFASYMAEQGFYVVGNDHLGHGLSVKTEDRYGFFHEKHGNAYLLGDMNELRKITHEKYPSLPYFILGHSMGSFLTRQYIALEGEGLNGAIISGTGFLSKDVLNKGMNMCKTIAAAKGWDERSKIITTMAFGGYNKRIKNPKSYTDWISSDEKVVEAYNNDPWCTFKFTVNGYYNMFYSIKDCENPNTIKYIPKDLPIFLVSGTEDPVGNYGKGVEQTYNSYKEAGIKDVRIKLYEGYRHEILNEVEKEIPYNDIKTWIEEHL